MNTARDIALARYREHFAAAPTGLVRSPGRVNLIGEHTDYNDGFVLPLAIEPATWIAFAPTEDNRVTLHSTHANETITFDPNAPDRSGPAWSQYARGMAWALRERVGDLHGWRGVVASDVPIGAGLSSSASFEMALGRVFEAVGEWRIDAADLARVGQRAENEWVGVNCGIMDQLACAAGRAGHALLIDCRSLECRPVPLPREHVVVVMDTGTRRSLDNTAYNERRAQCEAAAKFFGVPSLRDVSLDRFERDFWQLDPVLQHRARHVVTEIARTIAAAESLQSGQVDYMGPLMAESHYSLRDDYKVSSPTLDFMTAHARNHPACLGARMTGAGFGGCAIAIVELRGLDYFLEYVEYHYHNFATSSFATSRNYLTTQPRLFATRAADGASIMPVPA